MTDGLSELDEALARTGASVEPLSIAGTVVVVRDGAEGPEVLLLERPDRGSFAGAWVFPGGKVEAGDAGATEAETARSAGVRETWEETGLVLDPEAVGTLSCWEPPAGVRKRIRTWFFVAPAPADQALAPAAEEVVRAEWARPEDLLERHGRGGLTLYPPTWMTLSGLVGARDAAALQARVPEVPEHFAGVLREDDRGRLILWAGDAAYDEAAGRAASGSRNRLRIDRLPWEYERR